jgi:hypothetical protein
VSFLTDVAIVVLHGEDGAIAHVNRQLARDDPRPQQLARTGLEKAGAGGCKATSLVVYAGCFNYLDFGTLETAIRSAPWRLPGCVVAYIDGEGFPSTFVLSPARPDHWKVMPDAGW